MESTEDLMNKFRYLFLIVFMMCIVPHQSVGFIDPPSSNMTHQVFGSLTDGIPAAFGDFNSDEITDLFILQDNFHTVQILLGFDDTEPLLRPAPNKPLKCRYKKAISSVVPGDFDGDALMDVMLTLRNEVKPGEAQISDVIVLWGNLTTLECTSEKIPLLRVKDQPLAVFYSNDDFIVDLFGENEDGNRTFWEFNRNRSSPTVIPLVRENSLEAHHRPEKIRYPHSNAFLDLNGDNSPDLYITTEKNFEIWSYNEQSRRFDNTDNIPLPPGIDSHAQIGQTLFLDVELKGKTDHVVPVCFQSEGKYCSNGTIFVWSDGKWYNLNSNFMQGKKAWGFAMNGGLYTDTITARGGDFNMDGYPDIMLTLGNAETSRAMFLENVVCPNSCDKYERDFTVRWDALNPMNNDTVLGVFYDLMQDGVLDVIFVNKNQNGKYSLSAFKNNLDYDANFVKVMVITADPAHQLPPIPGPLPGGKHKRTPGTNLPGPKISYRTSTTEGEPRIADSTQLPQSAHFALGLPYTIFGLGRTPNFIESLSVGMWNKSRSWLFLIPNSQMVVISNPLDSPDQWKAQLFVTPSKLIIQSVGVLVCICLLIISIICVLYYQERREDKIERLRGAQFFHFDAM